MSDRSFPFAWPRLLLASASPRRRELLRQIGVPFDALALELPEQIAPGEEPATFAARMALEKARAAAGRWQGPPLPVLGADTVVVQDGVALGKPRDRDHFLRMMNALSGRTHEVVSAIALVSNDGCERVASSRSEVTFRVIETTQAAAYWATGEPRDKAGGYAVQGLGATFISHLAGSYSGVMGLPLFELAELLRELRGA